MDTIFYEAQRQGLYSFYVTLLNQTNIVQLSKSNGGEEKETLQADLGNGLKEKTV